MLSRTFWMTIAVGLALLTLKINTGVASLSEISAAGKSEELEHPRTELRVNSFTENRQQDQSLAIDNEGRILVAWGSRRQEFGTYGVFAQYLDQLGRPLGTEIHVNKHLSGHQMKPAVAFGPDGEAWIAWFSSEQDGHLGSIQMRRLERSQQSDASGNIYSVLAPTGEEIQINETASGDQFNPVVTICKDGTVFVCWISDHSGSRLAYGRLFDGEGMPITGEFRLGTRNDMHESLPALTSLSQNRVVAVWAGSDSKGAPRGIHGRIFLSGGEPAGEAFAIADSDQRSHVEPSVDSDGEDLFVVAWMSIPKGSSGSYQVSTRRFDGSGKPLGEPLFLNSGEEGYLNGGSVAMAPDGRFLLAYNVHHKKEDNPDGHRPVRSVSIEGRIFDPAGKVLVGPFRVNQFNEGQQDMQVGLNARHMEWSSLDQIAVTWHGNIEDDKRGVGLTVYAPADLNPEAPPAIEPRAADDISLDEFTLQQQAPPEWNPDWVSDSYLPMLPPAGPDFGFEAFTSTEWTPPDPDLAVGPNHIVGVVNIWIRIFDKSGNILLDQHLADFFGSTSFSFDPIAMYDPLVDRYIVASAEHDPSSRDFLNIAISDDNDPTGTWYTYRFETSSYCDYIDFPNLGSGPDAYYIATDCFGWPGGNQIHIFEKAPMLNGNPITIDHIQTSGSFNSVGSTKAYDASSPAAYFASAHAVGSPNIKIYAVTDPAGSPQLHSVNVNVGSYSQPPDAQQQGTSNRADTIDYRIKNGVVRDGIMYVCHNVDGGDGAAKSRWYKIDLRGWPFGQNPVKVDGGDVDPGNNIDTWYGDINVDSGGNVAMAVNRSSPDELIGVYRTFRLETDQAGTMRPTVEMQTSTTPEQGSRWGDYSGLEEDPSEPGTFWNHHEYRTSSWRTWTGRFAISAGIKLSNESDLIPGNLATIEVTNAGPGERVWFLYSLAGEGEGPSVPQLGGLVLGILEPVHILGSVVADDSGTATFEAMIPGGAPPVQIWFQSVARRGAGGDRSVGSNVTTGTIQ